MYQRSYIATNSLCSQRTRLSFLFGAVMSRGNPTFLLCRGNPTFFLVLFWFPCRASRLHASLSRFPWPASSRNLVRTAKLQSTSKFPISFQPIIIYHTHIYVAFLSSWKPFQLSRTRFDKASHAAARPRHPKAVGFRIYKRNISRRTRLYNGVVLRKSLLRSVKHPTRTQLIAFRVQYFQLFFAWNGRLKAAH